jgi:hypothetical protein
MSTERILRDISTLLGDHGEQEWALSFRRLAGEYTAAPSYTRREIRRLYGGMGSFSDLVLHSPQGQPLVAENDTLASLRSELWKATELLAEDQGPYSNHDK